MYRGRGAGCGRSSHSGSVLPLYCAAMHILHFCSSCSQKQEYLLSSQAKTRLMDQGWISWLLTSFPVQKSHIQYPACHPILPCSSFTVTFGFIPYSQIFSPVIEMTMGSRNLHHSPSFCLFLSLSASFCLFLSAKREF